MKKYFITGLVTLLPVTLTIIIVAFLINLLTEPFIGIMESILLTFGVAKSPKALLFLSQILILIFLFFFTAFLGFVTRWFFFHYIIRVGEYILHKIPLINSIYKTSKDVIHTIFTSDTKSFKQVVLVPFPNPGSYSIGLVTLENVPMREVHETDRVAVFVPTTPNPTSGFLMLFPKKDIKYLDMKIDDALKYVISCGVISSKFHTVEKGKA